jgi:hypothetical protein
VQRERTSLAPVVERLTDDQLAALKEWGEGLATVEQVEVQAAGRAIGLLVAGEIEALHREAWHQRLEIEALKQVVGAPAT